MKRKTSFRKLKVDDFVMIVDQDIPQNESHKGSYAIGKVKRVDDIFVDVEIISDYCTDSTLVYSVGQIVQYFKSDDEGTDVYKL